jgi:hypothetical protein
MVCLRVRMEAAAQRWTKRGEFEIKDMVNWNVHMIVIACAFGESKYNTMNPYAIRMLAKSRPLRNFLN